VSQLFDRLACSAIRAPGERGGGLLADRLGFAAKQSHGVKQQRTCCCQLSLVYGVFDHVTLRGTFTTGSPMHKWTPMWRHSTI
jgi:hypothetical protein